MLFPCIEHMPPPEGCFSPVKNICPNLLNASPKYMYYTCTTMPQSTDALPMYWTYAPSCWTLLPSIVQNMPKPAGRFPRYRPNFCRLIMVHVMSGLLFLGSMALNNNQLPVNSYLSLIIQPITLIKCIKKKNASGILWLNNYISPTRWPWGRTSL